MGCRTSAPVLTHLIVPVNLLDEFSICLRGHARLLTGFQTACRAETYQEEQGSEGKACQGALVWSGWVLQAQLR